MTLYIYLLKGSTFSVFIAVAHMVLLNFLLCSRSSLL